MNIRNFPLALQPFIQQGYPVREFDYALSSRIGYVAVADVIDVTGPLGEPQQHSRKGLARNGGNAAEFYTLTPMHYAATTDLNMVTSRVGIASRFLLSAAINGEQAARSLDELARGALWKAYNAPTTTMRPNNRASADDLRRGDVLTMGALLNAVAALRKNAVPEIDGVYNCYLDPMSARQLFADNDFRQLFTGATSASQIFRKGMVNDFLGLRFIPTTEAFSRARPDGSGDVIRRAFVVGQGALVQGNYGALPYEESEIVDLINGVAMVTREPADRQRQIISQSWYWVGGFAAPHEIENDTPVYRRAVIVEHMS